MKSFHHFRYQGNVEKLVVVIKDKEQVALERFIFSIQNMIEVEPFQKDSRFGLLSCVKQQRMTFFFLSQKCTRCHVRCLSRTVLQIFSYQIEHDRMPTWPNVSRWSVPPNLDTQYAVLIIHFGLL